MLARIILHSTDATILVVCYTNHALDSFLEDLLNVGITDMVRLGSSSKSDRLKEFNLFEKCSGKAAFTGEHSRRFGALRDKAEEAETTVARLTRSKLKEIGKGWWRTVEEHLEDTSQESWAQLRVTEDDLVDEEGFQIQGVNGKDYLWKRWLKGKPPSHTFQGRAGMPLWRMNKAERVQQKLKWQGELHEQDCTNLASALLRIKEARSEIRQLQDMKHSALLRRTRVIGCTTTKAAMVKHLLDDVSPGVVLVEEAEDGDEAADSGPGIGSGDGVADQHLEKLSGNGEHPRRRPPLDEPADGRGYCVAGHDAVYERVVFECNGGAEL